MNTPNIAEAGPRAGSPRLLANRRTRWYICGILAVALAGGLGWYGFARGSDKDGTGERNRYAEKTKAGPISVEVVHPAAGGIDRVCVQPGTVEPFEAADLYSKVSGYLIEQSVDIGSPVTPGQVLAKIAVPEYDRQVERDAARVQHADAVVHQMQARIKAAEADARVAEATVAVAKTVVKAKWAYRKYREKQLTRMQDLLKERAIDAKVVDESEDQYQASVEAETAATENVTASEQRLVAARAKIDQCRADLEEAKAEVTVATAELNRSRVLVAYAVITSPYDGVVTKRSFNRGDFIRSADAGGDRVPLLSVERTDKMRVVVQVPDRDVPYTDVGDKATLEIDALPGRRIEGAITLVASSEDVATRTMRVEVHVPNADGKLRRGMYGRATLILDTGHETALTIPSTALTTKADGSRASVRVVRDGVVRSVPVVAGADNGIRVEILSGLIAADNVIIRSNGATEDGTPVNLANR